MCNVSTSSWLISWLACLFSRHHSCNISLILTLVSMTMYAVHSLFFWLLMWIIRAWTIFSYLVPFTTDLTPSFNKSKLNSCHLQKMYFETAYEDSDLRFLQTLLQSPQTNSHCYYHIESLVPAHNWILCTQASNAPAYLYAAELNPFSNDLVTLLCFMFIGISLAHNNIFDSHLLLKLKPLSFNSLSETPPYSSNDVPLELTNNKNNTATHVQILVEQTLLQQTPWWSDTDLVYHYLSLLKFTGIWPLPPRLETATLYLLVIIVSENCFSYYQVLDHTSIITIFHFRCLRKTIWINATYQHKT